VLTATVTYTGGARVVTLRAPQAWAATATTTPTTPTTSAAVTETTVKTGPSPIAPEPKELAWTAGAFVVFAVVMRYVLYPRLRKGTDARYEWIRSGHEGADTMRAAAKTEVADYQAELAGVKAQAAGKLDVARRTLEGERSERLAVVNREISAERSRAAAEADAARAAVQDQLETAVNDVASRASELAIGKTPDPDVVHRVVQEVINAGAQR
jgi:F-type H+-transporting ATPase subunit b